MLAGVLLLCAVAVSAQAKTQPVPTSRKYGHRHHHAPTPPPQAPAPEQDRDAAAPLLGAIGGLVGGVLGDTVRLLHREGSASTSASCLLDHTVQHSTIDPQLQMSTVDARLTSAQSPSRRSCMNAHHVPPLASQVYNSPCRPARRWDADPLTDPLDLRRADGCRPAALADTAAGTQLRHGAPGCGAARDPGAGSTGCRGGCAPALALRSPAQCSHFTLADSGVPCRSCEYF